MTAMTDTMPTGRGIPYQVGPPPPHDWQETGRESGTSRAHLVREMRCSRCGEVTWLPMATMATPAAIQDEIEDVIRAARAGCIPAGAEHWVWSEAAGDYVALPPTIPETVVPPPQADADCMAAAADRARTALQGIVSGQLITSEDPDGVVVAMVRGHVDVVVGAGADHTAALIDAADRAPALAQVLRDGGARA